MKKYALRAAALYAAYTAGHWVGWSKGFSEGHARAVHNIKRERDVFVTDLVDNTEALNKEIT